MFTSCFTSCGDKTTDIFSCEELKHNAATITQVEKSHNVRKPTQYTVSYTEVSICSLQTLARVRYRLFI